MSVRVPAHLQEIAASLALRDWIHRKVFPLDVYFETIDLCFALLRRHDPPVERGEPPLDGMVVNLLAAALDREGELEGYVIDRATYPISDEQTWLRICQAAGWEILRVNAAAIDAGEWPK